MNIIKWFRFRNRRRVNRRLALARIGWVAILLICAGCEQAPQQPPTFRQGQIVDLRIGHRGQILKVYIGANSPFYAVRVNSDYGPKRIILQEFELVIK